MSGEQKPEGGGVDRRSNRRRRFIRVLIMAGLTLAFGIAALLLFPHDSTPRVLPAVLGVDVYSDNPLDAEHVQMSHDERRRATLLTVDTFQDDLGIYKHASPGAVRLTVTTPTAALLEKSCAGTWPVPATCTERQDTETAVITAPENLTNGVWTQNFIVEIPDESDAQFPLITNDEFATVSTPSLTFSTGGVLFTDYKLATTLSYESPDLSRFSWNSSATPSTNATGVSWTQTSLTGTPSQQLTGVDENRQRWNENATFLAGALLGVAGAALIGAVAELLPRVDGAG
jgi:hypothetical protein